MSEYEEYERRCNLIREENQAILDAFESWMLAKGLSKATAKNHRENIDFYINEFLLYESPKHASEGVDEVGMFLAIGSSAKRCGQVKQSRKSNATSLKKILRFHDGNEQGSLGGSQGYEGQDEGKFTGVDRDSEAI